MTFRNFVTPHCHPGSLDTAAKPESFVEWEVENGTGFVTATDHGTLDTARKLYDIAGDKKFKGKISPIMGLEAYLRDDNCPVLKSFGIEPVLKWRNPKTGWWIEPEDYEEKLSEVEKKDFEPFVTTMDYQKYFHLTMHFQDQKAYETACRLLSAADSRAEKHGSEYKPLFTWAQLEELGAENVTFGSGCLIGVVQRHIAFGERYDIAEAYYKKLRSLVKPGNFIVEAFPHICEQNWESRVAITLEDDTTVSVPIYRKVLTDQKYGRGTGIKAEWLAERWAANKEGHGRLHALMFQRKWKDVEKQLLIKDVKLIEGFIKNECTATFPDGDLQLPCNRFVLEMAKKYGDKILISDDSHFVKPEEKIVQDVKLLQDGNWRMANSYHRLSSDEVWPYFRDRMGIDQATFESWIENSYAWAETFKGMKLKPRNVLPTKFYPEDTLVHTFRLIQKHGRQAILQNPVYWNRLQAEIELLHRNGVRDWLPYFMIDEEVCDLYQRAGRLTGPGRGSAAGLLLTYLLEITHVDPIRYGLSMDRFMTKSRIESGKQPDIDQDLPDRDLLVDPKDDKRGWLRDRFGDCVAQISTDMTIKVRQGVLDVHRITSQSRKVPDDVAKLAHQFAQPPQGIGNKEFIFGYDHDGTREPGAIEWDPPLMEYVKKYPKEWDTVVKCLGITRGKSRHACAYLVSNEPISNFIPLQTINGVTCTQLTAAQVESSGGLKMDFLIVNSLRDIAACIKMVQERSGDTSQAWEKSWGCIDWNASNPFATLPLNAPSIMINGLRVPLTRVVPHKGKYVDIWDLPEDQAVFRDICESNTESVFQFGTPGAQKWLKHFNHVRPSNDGEVHKALDSIEALAAFTALDRPGPLDAYVDGPNDEHHNMLVEYARRARGEKPIGNFPLLDEMFPETYGVFCYQEQLTKLYQVLSNCSGAEADEFRVHISKKQKEKVFKDKAIFMPGATARVGVESAEKLWSMMETFSEYGFNKSHAVCYVIIGYACAFLKYHYPLEWWTAVLRHAKKEELTEKFWKHCGHLIALPDISRSREEFMIEGDKIRCPLTLMKGAGEAVQKELALYYPIASLEDLIIKIDTRRIKEGITEIKQLKTKTKTVIHKARTAIGDGFMCKLITVGAADSLFPSEWCLLDRLQHYYKVACTIRGEINKNTGLPKKSVPAKYRSLNPLEAFQLQKKLLPAFSRDLFPIMADIGSPGLRHTGRSWVYKAPGGQREYTVVSPEGLNILENLSPWPHGQKHVVAFAAYVQSYERKRAKADGRERAQVGLDIAGEHRLWMLWPEGREDRDIPVQYQRELTGAVVIALASKYREDKPFSIQDLIVVQDPLSDKEEESPEVDNDE